MYTGRINLHIYNVDKSFCTPATKEVCLAFQPYDGMRILSDGSEYIVDKIQWDIDSNTFIATVMLYPEWVCDSFLDDNFHREEAKRKGWSVLKGYAVKN